MINIIVKVFEMTDKRAFSRYSIEAAKLLGAHIRLNRKKKKWSEEVLSERAGISRATLQKIERGNLNCVLGLAFEVAFLVDVKLFESDEWNALHIQNEAVKEKTSVLLKKIHSNPQVVVSDDF